jgi:hypothetical protein
MMRDLAIAERAQLGLEYIEDAIVTLLTNHPDGLSAAQVAEILGLSTQTSSGHGSQIASGILQMLVGSGRVLWHEASGRYLDNPDKL